MPVGSSLLSCLDTTRLTTPQDTILNPALCSHRLSHQPDPMLLLWKTDNQLLTKLTTQKPSQVALHTSWSHTGPLLALRLSLSHTHGHSAHHLPLVSLAAVWFSWYRVHVQHNTFLLDLEECGHYPSLPNDLSKSFQFHIYEVGTHISSASQVSFSSKNSRHQSHYCVVNSASFPALVLTPSYICI